MQRKVKGQKGKEKPKPPTSSAAMAGPSAVVAEAVTSRIGGLSIAEHSGEARVALPASQSGIVHTVNQNQSPAAIWMPRAYGTATGADAAEAESIPVDQRAGEIQANGSNGSATQSSSPGLSKLFSSNLLEGFSVDNSTYTCAQVRATFYPKFENEKSDQEIRIRMIEMVSRGLATLEVSLKHSGSLFMYAGNEGGAYAKNSFGNIYTAVGVFVLGRMFQQGWGSAAAKKQAEFNEFLEKNRMCISMELVTAVLGDHGQRPREDYVVVTAVTELGKGKPIFYSTPEMIAFCRRWRLPTNHVWLFSSRKSVTSFFATYDALCEEGTATPVCRALDEVADVSVQGSVDHITAQGEILEGLVARIVSHESAKHIEEVLKDFPIPPNDGGNVDFGPSLREICAANRSDEKQEMIRLMREKRYPAAFKCYHNFHKIESTSSDNLFYKMVIHVHSDSAFRRYQRDMRYKPGLWPLYRGFFVDINLFKANKERAAEIANGSQDIVENVNENGGTNSKDDLADDDANLMIKLKFLTYKIRTFLIRNGLSILFKEGPPAYKTYYLRQMKNWGTSSGKQRQLSKMLDEWAIYIRRKYGNKQLSSSIYLSEAEPFLEQYAKRSVENQALIGSAGSLVRAEDFLAIVEGGRDEEGDLEMEREAAPPSPTPSARDSVLKDEGMIVFFPGIPGCAKSALCKEILNAQGGLGDDRPVHSLMGDLIKGKYWQKIAEERRRKPYSIMLADKNAPNEEVWRQIEDMCRRTKASAVPVIPDSEGSYSNPFSLDALAVFLFRVLQRVNHPSRQEFEDELVERFGSLVKMPLLKSDRLESSKGTYAKDWAKWEKQLRDILLSNTEYLNSIQVPFDFAVKLVLEQLRSIAKGDYTAPSTETRKFGSIVFAAVSLPIEQIHDLLKMLSGKNAMVEAFLKDKDMESSLRKAHITLAHKRSHGVTAVANYGHFVNRQVPIDVTALLYNPNMAAFEARLGTVDGEAVTSKNEWPHITLWTGEGVAPKEANNLPQLLSQGKAARVEIDPPVTISGPLEFY
ncbi:hypothetical protein CDL15_Pgr028158 [Punica granatum]|uniref:tRNA ligase phosphodiesterase domain-containing protein n=1 Tax=Punica granatum TaxID=22663 RepID=A0A218XHG4_PUNGR|nr:hypothetical protein CDL15_Pgr028158 [Punica granatum]